MEKKELKLYGMQWYIALGAILIGLLGIFTETFGTDMPNTLIVMFAIGIPLYEIGERIPIWNKYIGGGIVAAFLGTALMVHFKILPEMYATAIDDFTSEVNFLTMFIVVLIAGSVLSLNRKILIKSFIGYIPAILGGLGGAMLLGVLTGLIFGISPSEIILNYVLPVMGGGNGGGAVPLSQIYGDVTGREPEEYYQFAIIILTIANIFAIIFASLLNGLGAKFKGLTGDKKTIIRDKNAAFDTSEESHKAELIDVAGGLVLGLASYGFGLIMSQLVLPEIFGVKIHTLAYMIIFVVILAATGVIPGNLRAGAKRLQSFFSKYLVLIIMVGVGVDLDINELIAALSFQNMIIAIAVVLGAILGSAGIGYLVGFYPIDSAVTAGLCMANRGGSGDLAVLGAADRMDLMAYAQLSSRLGGAIVLIIGSIIFSFLL
ncbi:2-hydroxycarboxylate transporter family protein [Atopobacter phocae]|uniref:2-hydroxycarboxylate transporter family protein n=1 Tax=Atopobacter phocae TaxID=136492 RepID=UPI00046FD50A|nr:2-hydroxycarboxylate transporter family protein [Atopobacter phocae]